MTKLKSINSFIHSILTLILNLLRWGIYYVLVLIFFFLKPLISKKILKKSFNELVEDINFFALSSLKVFGVKPELLNPHNINLDKGYIIAGNHRSFFDQIAISGLFPRTIHILAKSTYFSLPVFGQAMRTIESIPVENRRLGTEARKILDKSVKYDEAVCFFVEGTRGQGRDLLAFKPGAFNTAAEYDKEILPIYILGTEQCLSKHKSRLQVKPGNISIVIGKPESFSLEDLDAQIADFEKRYTKIHNHLYDQFESYLLMNKNDKKKFRFSTFAFAT